MNAARVHAEPVGTDTVDHGSVRRALELARLAPSLHNSQPWWWHVGDGVVHLHADLDRWLPATDPDALGLLVSCGAALHHLRVALAAEGVGAVVHRLPDADDRDLLAVLGLRPHRGGAFDRLVDPEQASAIPLRRTDRRRYRPLPLPTGHLDALALHAATHGAQIRLVADPDLLRTIEASVLAAAAEHAVDPHYRDELYAATVGRSPDDGVPPGSVPVGGRHRNGLPVRAFPHAELADPQADLPDAATVLVLGTSSDDRLSRIRAGEAASAVLLHATRLRLASSVLTEPLENACSRALLSDEVLGGSLCPQLVIRVGEPSQPVLRPTPRRALDDQIEYLPPGR